MNCEGYIAIHRKMLDWEWYSDVNTFRVFMHCLLKANWKDGRFKGQEVKRGQLATSLQHLADETGLSVRNVRTALDHLKETGEVTDLRQGNYRIITILNYCKYQGGDKPADNPSTIHRQSIDNPSTTIEERNKEIREEGNKYIPPLISPPKGTRTKAQKAEHNVELFDELIKGFDFSDSLAEALRGWMRYKGAEKNFVYQETGMGALLSQTKKHVSQYGEAAVTNCITMSMGNGYQGILWDRLKDGKPRNGQGYTFADLYREEFG